MLLGVLSEMQTYKYSLCPATVMNDCVVVAGDVIRHRGPLEKEYSLQTTKNEEMFVTCKLDWVPSGPA